MKLGTKVALAVIILASTVGVARSDHGKVHTKYLEEPYAVVICINGYEWV